MGKNGPPAVDLGGWDDADALDLDGGFGGLDGLVAAGKGNHQPSSKSNADGWGWEDDDFDLDLGSATIQTESVVANGSQHTMPAKAATLGAQKLAYNADLEDLLK